MIRVYNNNIVKSGGKVNKTVMSLSKFKKLKNIKSEILTYINIQVIEELMFFIANTSKTSNFLRQAFIIVSIL